MAQSVPPTIDTSDKTVIELLVAHGRTRNQAECAVNLLTSISYNEAERYRILSDPNNSIHKFCFLGNVKLLALMVALILAVIFVYYCFVTGRCDKVW